MIDPAQDTRRPANWSATATNAPNRATPGAANATRAALAAFPGVWINEVVPQPDAAILDNAGESSPFVELHNPTSTSANLSGLWLSDSLANPTRWAFPDGTTVAPGAFLRVWLDNEPGETAPGHLHAGFRPAAGSGMIVLSPPSRQPCLARRPRLDRVQLPAPGRGFGSIPDGSPYTRRPLYVATPGATNNAFVPVVEVVINEFLAPRTPPASPIPPTATSMIGSVFIPGPAPADLSGYFLTDNLTNRTASVLPPGTIVPAGGFLLVWADGETGQNNPSNGWFHTSFSLSRNGEQVGLFGPDGSLIDGYTFTTQTNNISMGRYPDGPDGEWISLEASTPETFNFVPGGNLPPGSVQSRHRPFLKVLPRRFRCSPRTRTPVSPSTSRSRPTRPPASTSSSRLLTWTPSEAQGPGVFSVTIRATDSGTPPRSATLRVQVQVNEANLSPPSPRFRQRQSAKVHSST